MNVTYQIFVSSTFEDLREQRNEVIKACLNMGHIPVDMAMFNAAEVTGKAGRRSAGGRS